MPPLWQRIKEWICAKAGHSSKVLEGNGDPEICTRCNLLLSTAFSRARKATP